jgi:protein-S-isoprenylcysteine O-methyltransferase Ste14
VLVWLSSWLLAAKWSSPTERRPNFRLEATYRLLTAAGAILLFGLHQRWPSTEVALWHLGPKAAWTLVATAVCGFVFAWWARIELGRLWSSGVTRKTDHRIVTTGPYKLVRHPIYSGIIFAVLATAVIRGTAAGLFGAVLIVLGIFVKSPRRGRFPPERAWRAVVRRIRASRADARTVRALISNVA